jgi:hypothetical protein
MDHADFYIGLEFWFCDRQWRCTDRGVRTVIAIRIDATEITINEAGSTTSRTLLREEAERDGWFNGPPYAVAEHVIDEYDLEGCTLTREEL